MFRLWSVILAGEAIFVLPFMVPRLFREVLLEHWDLTNLQLGTARSLYGIVAAVAYFAGGPLADRFSPRHLMTAALVSTAAVGALMLGKPSPATLGLAYAAFGLTTILLFWSAMIRVTHDLGGHHGRGMAFGVLDGGRGLFAAVLAWAMVTALGDAPEPRVAILIGIGVLIAAAAAVWLTLRADAPMPPPPVHPDAPEIHKPRFDVRQVTTVLRSGAVWRQGVVLLCAYIGYKAVDVFSIYAGECYELSKLRSAQVTAAVFWLRPVAALLAGFTADRINPFTVLATLFGGMAVGSAGLIAGADGSAAMVAIFAAMATAAAAAYAMRAVYFAVMDALNVPEAVVGTAAGVISVVGVLPDIFFSPLTGYWIDHLGTPSGFQTIFAMVTAAAVLGLIVSLDQLRRVARQRSGPAPG